MGGVAHPNERRLVAKVSHARKSSGRSAERTGRKEERKDRLRSDALAFGMAEDWKATALVAKVCVETAMEGGRSFMAAWRKTCG